jgi:hypothetical protein
VYNLEPVEEEEAHTKGRKSNPGYKSCSCISATILIPVTDDCHEVSHFL